MEQLAINNIAIDELSFKEKEIRADVLRLDLLHPVISGNKWFKLQYYLEEAKRNNCRQIITFGGAWSNHIVATAAAAKMFGFQSSGIIRGEEPNSLSFTLAKAKESGMQLHFISREDYRNKIIPQQLISDSTYIIPEGGYGKKGAIGAATILNYCQKKHYSHICAAVGTGTMLAGLVNGSSPSQKLIGIAVLKNEPAFESIQKLLNEYTRSFELFYDYHFGGYAKHTPELLQFMNKFYLDSKIPSDFVYTGKLFYAISDLVEKKYFSPGSRLLIIHSGGLQGNQSLSKGTLIF